MYGQLTRGGLPAVELSWGQSVTVKGTRILQNVTRGLGFEEEGEMGETCSTGRELRNLYKTVVGKSEGKEQLRRCGRIKKYNN